MKFITLLFLVLSVSCGKEVKKSSASTQNVKSKYSATSFTVKVYFEPGAEPYTTESLLPIQYWSLLEQNLKALFVGRKVEPVVNVPKTISEMTALPLSGDLSWTIDDVLALAKRNTNSSDPSAFQIFFVNGFAAESQNIIGFHISNTNVMVIFKEVIRNSATSGTLDAVPKYVEQATIIHEMGHALGLVNNGVKMVTAHQDTAHGAHCSNPECVMYYSNEGAAALMNFARKAIQNQSTVMFDDQCLKDTRSY